ncbi:MAG: peptide-methionine (S)-S-oxide reductase MsrA [Bacteroidota bacterium]
MRLLIFFCLLLSQQCTPKISSEASQVTTKVNKPTPQQLDRAAEAIFAGGCFWCIEAVFERVEGVLEAVSGYTAGETKDPTYYEVGNGTTGHTEAVKVYYNPAVITYEKLVEVFFAAHDPTQLNRQGPDVGTQYRSGIYYQTPEELNIVKKHITYLEKSEKYAQSIVTEVQELDVFYEAEEYHQDYYELHPENPYVQRVSKPKVEKFKQQFPALVKAHYKK